MMFIGAGLVVAACVMLLVMWMSKGGADNLSRRDLNRDLNRDSTRDPSRDSIRDPNRDLTRDPAYPRDQAERPGVPPLRTF